MKCFDSKRPGSLEIHALFIASLPIGNFHCCRHVFLKVILDISWEMSWTHDDHRHGIVCGLSEESRLSILGKCPTALGTRKSDGYGALMQPCIAMHTWETYGNIDARMVKYAVCLHK